MRCGFWRAPTSRETDDAGARILELCPGPREREEDGLSEIERSRLDELAQEINAEHQAFRRAFKATYRSALRAGDLLNEAKAEAGHGNWTAWVEENCEFSMRTAQVYMRIANNRDRVEASLKNAASAHLSIEGVLKELSPPTKLRGVGTPPERESSYEIMRRGIERGAPDDEIATFAGVNTDTVRSFRTGELAADGPAASEEPRDHRNVFDLLTDPSPYKGPTGAGLEDTVAGEPTVREMLTPEDMEDIPSGEFDRYEKRASLTSKIVPTRGDDAAKTAEACYRLYGENIELHIRWARKIARFYDAYADELAAQQQRGLRPVE